MFIEFSQLFESPETVIVLTSGKFGEYVKGSIAATAFLLENSRVPERAEEQTVRESCIDGPFHKPQSCFKLSGGHEPTGDAREVLSAMHADLRERLPVVASKRGRNNSRQAS